MARADWEYVTMRKELYERMRKFTDSAQGKSKGLGAPRELISFLVAKFLDESDIE